MNEQAINDLKINYNHYLSRYLNGCKYLEENPSEIDRWIPELLDVLDNLNVLSEEIIKYIEVTDAEILSGFKIEGR